MQKDSLILTLLELLDALESKVNKYSHKPSKRPSSDSPTKKTRYLREPSGKKADGQTGHKGTLLRQIERPTQVIQYRQPSSTITPQALPPWRSAMPARGTVPCVRGTDGIVPGHRAPRMDCALRLQPSAYQHISGRRGRGGTIRPASRPACSLPLNCSKMTAKYIVFFYTTIRHF